MVDEKKISKAISITLVIPNEEYNNYTLAMTKEMSKQYKAICYVSLNKLAHALSDQMKKKKINRAKFFVIDGMTQALIPKPKEFSNCIYLTGASNMKELSISINEAIKTGLFDCLIIDSISTLGIYNKKDKVLKFIQEQIGHAKNNNCTTIFTCLKNETKASMVSALGKISDQIIKIEKPKPTPKK